MSAGSLSPHRASRRRLGRRRRNPGRSMLEVGVVFAYAMVALALRTPSGPPGEVERFAASVAASEAPVFPGAAPG